MIGKIPELLESLEYFRNWAIYEDILINFEKVNYYFGDLIKEWVCDTKSPFSNPLEIQMISDLINNKSQNLEDRLNNFELHVGKDILVDYINELRGTKSPEDILKKLKSLDFESQVFSELKKTSSRIIKLKEIGDWETEGKIVSVKSILDLDLNHQLIENLITSLFYIKENDIIREYNIIRIEKGMNINDPFRNIISNYLRYNIINDLNVSDSLNLKFPEIGETRNFVSNDLTVSIDTYIGNQGRTIKVDFTSKLSSDSKITIEFRKDDNSKCLYSIQYDTNSFWFDEGNQDEDNLLKYVTHKIEDLDKGYEKYKQTHNNDKSFEGWITLLVHSRDENHILKENKFENKVKMIRSDIKYKIYLLAVPQWNFDNFENQIYEI